jgi:adenylate cyclase
MANGSTQKPTGKFRLTISAKLIGLIAILLISSIATIVYQSTKMYVENDRGNIQVSNVETTETLAIQTRDIFGNLTEKMRFIGTILLQDPQNVSNNPLVQDFFDSDKDFVGIFIHKTENGEWTRVGQVFSPEFVASGDIDGTRELAMLKVNKNFSTEKLLKGEPQITPMKIADGLSLIAVAIPLNSHFTGLAFIKPSKLAGIFGENTRGSSYLVDHQGNILSHTDSSKVGENVAQLPVVKELLSGGKPQNLVPYTDPWSGESRLASYRVIGFGGLGVVSELPEALAYQAAHTMAKTASHVALIILFIAFWAGYLYSSTLTRPITKLVEAAQRIASGDFKINLAFRGQDEIAHLSNAFNEMAKGLEERDRVKETFNKFHNKEIAEKLLSGEVKLGGERKEATVFFSDVRGFTAMSESMQPEEVVEMLNEYMTRMVSIIRSHHGIVDKYIGDAIMGLWGVPIGGDNDLYNALRACLQMREELAKLNQLRISRGQNALKIGMGLNVGPVIAGNIGSVEKMEYTVIGDTVNLASRMESMTKEYGTDLLIPKNIYDRLKDRFIFEECKAARVKGKSAAIEIYKVKGYIDGAGNGIVIETPYSSYAAEKSDKVVHDDAPMPAREEVAAASVYFVEMYGEVMGPFTPEEFKSGISSQEFPKDARFSTTKDGKFLAIGEFGLMTLAVGEAEEIQFVSVPPFSPPPLDLPPEVTVEEENAPTFAAPTFSALEFAAPTFDAPPTEAPPMSAPAVEAPVAQEVPSFVQITAENLEATQFVAPPELEIPLEAAPRIVTPPPFRHHIAASTEAAAVVEETMIISDVVTEVEAEPTVLMMTPLEPSSPPPDAPPVSFEAQSTAPSFAPPDAPSAAPSSEPPPSFAPEVAPPAFPATELRSDDPTILNIELEDKPAA